MKNNSKGDYPNSRKFDSKEDLTNYVISLYDSGKTMLEIADDIGRSN